MGQCSTSPTTAVRERRQGAGVTGGGPSRGPATTRGRK